ncbi:MAG TPA: peptide ABC transporter ATP-binding protein, partial [Clostridiales bacterium]|nr:peptide ABC transporter ATP-binding protein [Clostridiales bacterium]
MELLRAEHLTKTYGKDENVVAALNDVSLTINKGEFV